MKRLSLVVALLSILGLAFFVRHNLVQSARVDFVSCLAAVAQKTTIIDVQSVPPKWTPLDPAKVELSTEIPDHCQRKHYVHWGQGLVHQELLDRWDTPLRYEARSHGSGVQRRVISAGPDKKFGTADDISSDYFNEK
jgi:hypothetical protein